MLYEGFGIGCDCVVGLYWFSVRSINSYIGSLNLIGSEIDIVLVERVEKIVKINK